MTVNLSDCVWVDHRFELPVNHHQPDGRTINVFARELRAHGREAESLPWLVYLQGGPGFPAPRPTALTGWMKRAAKQFRILLLDQRGTGQSTPQTHQTLAHLTAEQQAEYLQYFRADQIVADAEAIRQQLGIERWSLLGQSFGGFCALTYLSFYPDSLKQVYITGGIPPIHRSIEEVYQATFARTAEKNQRLWQRFPGLAKKTDQLAQLLRGQAALMPNGQQLTAEQIQALGIDLGRSGGAESIYHLLDNAVIEVPEQGLQVRYEFLQDMLAHQGFLTNPIYGLLHESIYCEGEASNWAAQRVMDSLPEFSATQERLQLVGEMVFPWMFEQLQTLKPLQSAAQILAEKSDWPALYDRQQLANNTVPVAAAMYTQDMFVEYDFSRETLSKMANARAWETNEYEHNGIGVDGERILDKLIAMADDIERCRC
ncbi:alpha/beta hydrolase [Bacterioplanes sanyensis]|uniref:Alpha/beta hydrolase n=1 Tax=Bacterioplanes sanyensis TaxID=1249553 RepID=A0A222FKJ5_9GAMM|nr:alpha/beta fold hydrolase [Bacterioplanes sanyensis]ASP39106.1 alpha/beta hydrolase [Bacterioplanes sanyensis]